MEREQSRSDWDGGLRTGMGMEYESFGLGTVDIEL